MHVISYQLKLIKMRAELANLNHCAVQFLSRAAVNLCWYYCAYRIPNIDGYDQYSTGIPSGREQDFGNSRTEQKLVFSQEL